MSGWGSLLSIYESVPDAATGETILVRRPSGTPRSSTAAPSPFNSVGAPAAAGAPPSFGSTPVPAAVASLFGGGSMSNPAFGAVTTPSFQFRAAAAGAGAGAAARNFRSGASGHRAATVPDPYRDRSRQNETGLPLHHQDASLPGPHAKPKLVPQPNPHPSPSQPQLPS